MGTLYHCPVDGRTVLFDLAGDRYFLVPEPLQPQFDSWLADDSALPPAFIRPLLVNDATASGANTGQPELAAPIPRADRTLERGPTPPAFVRIFSNWRWQRMASQVRGELATLGLATVIERVRCEKQALAMPCDPTPIARRLRADQRYRMISGDCLVQSLTLMRALHRVHSTATLVFGVTLDPFRAHSWVQHEHCVLNDEVDTVASYRPILTL